MNNLNIEQQRRYVNLLKKEWAAALIEYGVGSFGEERHANALWREVQKLRQMEADIEQQRRHVEALRKKWREALEEYGIGSTPELETQGCWWREVQKLRQMEADNEKS